MNPIILTTAQAVKHSIMRTVSVVCVLLVCAGLYYAVYRTFIKPRPTESYAQHADNNIINIEVYNPEDTFFLGVKLFGFNLGISKPTVKKINEISQESQTTINEKQKDELPKK